MKYRSGFVSNSSSSSFIMYGFLIPENLENPFTFIVKTFFNIPEEQIKKEMSENKYYKDKINDINEIEDFCQDIVYNNKNSYEGIDILCGEGTPDDGIMVGKELFCGDASIDMGNIEYSVEELDKIVNPLKEIIENKCNENIPVKFYAGNMLT